MSYGGASEVHVEVDVVTVAACATAVVATEATRADLPDVIVRALDDVWAHLRASDLETSHNVVLYLGDTSAPGGAPVEVGVQVDRSFPSSEHARVQCSALPAGRVARAIHRGPYDRLAITHAAVVRWCEQHGHVPTGVSWEIYGDWSDDPSERETEVIYALVD